MKGISTIFITSAQVWTPWGGGADAAGHGVVTAWSYPSAGTATIPLSLGKGRSPSVERGTKTTTPLGERETSNPDLNLNLISPAARGLRSDPTG